MPYDIDHDPYTDDSTGVLRNLLGLETLEALNEAEAQITSVEITTLLIEDLPPLSKFNPDLLLSIHRKIFGEIYAWAVAPRSDEVT